MTNPPLESADGRSYAAVKLASLIGAHAAVALTLSLAALAGGDFLAVPLSGWGLPITIGFFVSQLALTAVWAALGRTIWLVRWLAMLAAALWVTTFVKFMFPVDFAPVLWISLETCVIVWLGLWLLRVYAGPATREERESATTARFQFTLGQFFIATAMVAVFIIALRLTGELIHALPRRGFLQGIAIYFAIAAWPAAWLGMTAPRPWLWIIPAVAAACLGATVGLHVVFGWRFSDAWLIGAAMMSEAAFTYLSLCVIRWAGYGWSGGLAGRRLRNQ